MATSNLENPVCHILFRQEHENSGLEHLGHSPFVVRLVTCIGVINAITGIWECTQAIDAYNLEGGCIPYKIGGKILLFAGSLLLVMSAVTIFEAGRFMRLSIYSLLEALSIVLLLETIGGSLAFVTSSSVAKGLFNRSLLLDLERVYSRDQLVTFAWDDIQRTYHCCGVKGPDDWKNSYWYDTRAYINSTYPSSCCDDDNSGCNEEHVEHDKGCGEKASDVLHHRLNWTWVCAFSSIVIHVASHLVLSFLYRKV